MTSRNPEASIRCDICNKRSDYNDPREPWQCFGEWNPKPTWRCDDCLKAVVDATAQKYPMYPEVVFDTEEQQAAWDKMVKEKGFHTITIGPTIKMSELKQRRFK